MTNYVKTTNFTAKDSLPTSDPGKLVKGYDFDVEFSAVATAVASKADSYNAAFTGTPTAPTAAAATNTTQLATTAHVYAERSNTATLTNKTLTSPVISGGSISGIADLSVADGGTGSSTASGARTNLGLVIGSDIPSTTGSGASGTWGISITGNAATATSASTVTNGVYTTGNQTIGGVKTFSEGINVDGQYVGMKNQNLAFGNQVFDGVATGLYSTAMGVGALKNLSTGDRNAAFGNSALYSNTTGSNNTAFGSSTLYENETGSYNSAFGRQSGYNITTGNGNTLVGYDAGGAVTTGNYNTLCGYSIATGLTTGSYNVGIGYVIFENATMTGDYNVGIGKGAGYNLTSGYNNIFLGLDAGINITSGYDNIAIGRNAGGYLTVGSNNIYIGNSNSSSWVATNELVINSTSTTRTGKGSGNGYITAGTSGSIYQGNNSSSWATTSDQRIKENFVDVTDGLSIINALNPVEFDYITTKQHDVGFKAQEYMEVLPAQVFQHAANEEEQALAGEDKIYGIQRNLDPYLVSAIKELTKRLEEAEAKLQALSN